MCIPVQCCSQFVKINGLRSVSFKIFLADSASYSPDGASEQRVKGVQPVVHLFVVGGLQKDPAMLSAHSECVGSLETG